MLDPTSGQITAWANALESADDFKLEVQSPYHQAWRHMWQGVSIMLNEGKGASGCIRLLSQVIWSMEEDTPDAQQGDHIPWQEP